MPLPIAVPAVLAQMAALPSAWRFLLPGAVLLLAAILALLLMERHLRSRRSGSRDPGPQPGDDHLKLALWGSGEELWDYDLDQRRLQRIRTSEGPQQDAEPTLLTRVGPVPAIHPVDLPAVIKRLRSHLEGESPFFLSEHRMDLLDNGVWIWVRVRGRVAERDAEGRPVRISGIARDITASRNAEDERRIAGEVLHSMNEAVAVLDWDYRFISVNPAFTRITGYLESEVMGQSARTLDSDRHDDVYYAQLDTTLLRDGHWQGDTWRTRKDGEDILCHLQINLVRDHDGDRHLYVMVLSDITEQNRAEQELRYLANYDTLTSLPNRSLLSERLSRAVVRARRESGRVAVLFVDLDRFKDVNDSLGHSMGDRVLRAAAARVLQAVGPQHTVARLSGDEFTVVLEDIGSAEEAERVAQGIIDAFAVPLSFGDRHELVISPSIGISLYPEHAEVPSELLKHADTAMYQAKAVGRRAYALYSAAMDEQTRRRATLAGALRKALDRNELSLVYQPRYSLLSECITGVEALLRWNSDEFGSVPPAEFIPLAEESGMIQEIGEWVLRGACRTLRDWQKAGYDHLGMSVNLSAMQLLRGDLHGLLVRTLAETEVDPRKLELELTESVVMANPEQNADTLRRCRELGVTLAIDDFGTGYSSLAYLKRLPITALKIDREFIGDLTHDADDEAITSIIITMGHALGLKVVAEGVESPAQLQFLREHGCDEIQGHLVAPALEPGVCLRFLAAPVSFAA